MLVFLIKFILCSGLLFFAYVWLLEREKTPVFKRFYLLGCLFSSLVIPFITIESEAALIPVKHIQYFNTTAIVPLAVIDTTPPIQEQSHTITYLMVAVYMGITMILWWRFGRNIFMLLWRIKQSPKTSWKGVTLILSEKTSVPYSFGNYIFVGKSDYEQGHIAEEILQHELAHVQQKHSIDVILIELLQLFFWFNPFLYFYRKAIQTNHEYLADAAVLNSYQDISTYQLIILQYISKQNGYPLTSSFNYLTFKKRLMMMTKNKPTKTGLSKQLLLIPILGAALFIFSTKIIAQEAGTKNNMASTPNGLDEKELKVYKAIEAKYFTLRSKTNKHVELDQATADRLEAMYKRMSKAQQKETRVFFIPQPKPSPKATPSLAQLSLWQDTEKYSVWIDGKKIQNAKLSNYNTSDFSLWSVGKIRRLSVNDGKPYVVQLTTNSSYQAYYDKVVNNKKSAMLVQLDNSIKWKR